MLSFFCLGFKLLLYYLFSNSIGLLQYQRKYFQGRWFEKWSSKGWEWCFKCFWTQFFLGINHGIKWPVNRNVTIAGGANITFDINDLNNFQGFGVYYQCMNENISFGKGCFVANNCGFITANHNLNDLQKHDKGKKIIIGNKCWIGMNSIVLPGVLLGDNTVVGAGSVVTKSFPQGNVVIAGNPAKIIKKI